MFWKNSAIIVALAASVVIVSRAHAQAPAAPKTSNRQTQLTDEQIRDVLILRALQTRGGRSRGVQRGVPQFVPYGNPFFMGLPAAPAQNARSAGGGSSDPKRAARAQRLREARERTVAEREKAVQKRTQARAAARAKAAKAARVRAQAKKDPAD